MLTVQYTHMISFYISQTQKQTVKYIDNFSTRIEDWSAQRPLKLLFIVIFKIKYLSLISLGMAYMSYIYSSIHFKRLID